MPLSEWQEVCQNNFSDPDEANFIIRKGDIPVGWLKVNGLQGDMAWISMLIIHEKYQRQGIGSFAVCFAENFVRLKGFAAIGIHTNADNIAAQKCYKQLGYTIIDEGECTNGDGKKRRSLTFYRDHLDALKRSERYQSIAELIEARERAKNILGIEYRSLSLDDIESDMLKNFNRYKEVSQCWRKCGNEYVVEEIRFVENWTEDKKTTIVDEDFIEALEYGGKIFAAYDRDKLIGFAFYDGRPIGSQNQYHWLVMLHVSYEYRNHGIGKALFKLCSENAKNQGAKKFYISANSSIESQAFYRAIGCIDAKEVNQELFEAEPYDIHMEYVL